MSDSPQQKLDNIMDQHETRKLQEQAASSMTTAEQIRATVRAGDNSEDPKMDV